MPDQPDQPNSTSGADPASESPQPSLREIAEQAYDEGSTDAEAPSASQEGRARDSQGRFVPKSETKSGEAEPEAPSPETPPETQTQDADPAAAARSNQPPDHWSAEDRAVFERLPPDAKAMLQRRYSEMEADYTRKSQANASAVQAVNALSPIFDDPDISRTLQESKVNAVQLIHEWATIQKRALSPNVHDRAALMYEMAQRMGFDPARLFAVNRQPSQLPPEVAKDPAVRYMADKLGSTASELQELRNQVQGIRQAEAEKHEQESLRTARGHIDSWADEKGPDGKPLRPDFNDQLPFILELFEANPKRDLKEAYDMARRMNPKTWESMVAAERARVGSQQSLDRARAANRGNVRGITSPVSKPSGKPNSGSLRDVLDASADEVGF